jgi:hypothetical protein
MEVEERRAESVGGERDTGEEPVAAAIKIGWTSSRAQRRPRYIRSYGVGALQTWALGCLMGPSMCVYA